MILLYLQYKNHHSHLHAESLLLVQFFVPFLLEIQMFLHNPC